ncbi:hypothetical protein M501DRAFT_1034080 [Patellaria atrata CBS 101060]|uniref:HAUS augmin-like complex subunit 1 n=1 Tax=Patellaria atrata CBS 101060 TaxID=1346257 RepID=A0A9P4S5R2_9PEZI|nr:hypothetical protein M501DRAFT_1034080 [Patellaria atrata CBS 101060]
MPPIPSLEPASTDLTPTALFSPSKARQQRVLAQDWAHVETWLSSHYPGRSIPPFERNEETLKALLALTKVNERADEEGRMLRAVESEVVQKLRVGDEDSDPSGLLGTLREALTPAGETALTALAGLGTELALPSTSPTVIAESLISLQSHIATLSMHIRHLSALHDHLTTTLEALRQDLQDFPSSLPPAPSATETQSYARATKLLRTKIAEYNSRLSSLPPSTHPNVSITALIDAEAEVRALRTRIEELEQRVKAFGGLAGDREGLRRMIGKMESELEALKGRREGLLVQLVRCRG